MGDCLPIHTTPMPKQKKRDFLLRRWGSIEGRVSRIMEVRSNQEWETACQYILPQRRSKKKDIFCFGVGVVLKEGSQEYLKSGPTRNRRLLAYTYYTNAEAKKREIFCFGVGVV